MTSQSQQHMQPARDIRLYNCRDNAWSDKRHFEVPDNCKGGFGFDEELFVNEA